MSMLSSQVEEIRKAAMTYRMLGRHTLANVLLEAAESITELRGALSVASVDYRHLSEENDKLRELVRAMWGCISHIGEYDVFYYDMAEDGCGMSCTVNGEHCCADKLHDRMRELGVEVNG